MELVGEGEFADMANGPGPLIQFLRRGSLDLLYRGPEMSPKVQSSRISDTYGCVRGMKRYPCRLYGGDRDAEDGRQRKEYVEGKSTQP